MEVERDSKLESVQRAKVLGGSMGCKQVGCPLKMGRLHGNNPELPNPEIGMETTAQKVEFGPG